MEKPIIYQGSMDFQRQKVRVRQLRIDKGYLRGARNLECRFITVIGVFVNNTYSERAYFSLFNDVYIILIGKYFRKL